ncbi:MAG: hypothetical protein J6T10_18675 [Methanobrevibacter sp.]|nr:hypothetical protein [Methanobrevibacter sp.]
MITIAIDASTKSTGVAVFKDKELIQTENFINSNKSVLKRIKYMTDNIEKLYLQQEDKVQVIMEQVIPDNLNDAKWTRNQATFKALFYLQAAIVLMFDHYDIEVELIGASTWRKWCGIKQGGANRETLKFRDMEFAKSHYGDVPNDDVADAICIGHGKINHEPTPAAFNWE